MTVFVASVAAVSGEEATAGMGMVGLKLFHHVGLYIRLAAAMLLG
jgi:hypothetical protein